MARGIPARIVQICIWAAIVIGAVLLGAWLFSSKEEVVVEKKADPAPKIVDPAVPPKVEAPAPAAESLEAVKNRLAIKAAEDEAAQATELRRVTHANKMAALVKEREAAEAASAKAEESVTAAEIAATKERATSARKLAEAAKARADADATAAEVEVSRARAAAARKLAEAEAATQSALLDAATKRAEAAARLAQANASFPLVASNPPGATMVPASYTPVNYGDGTWVKLYSEDRTSWSWQKKDSLPNRVDCTPERCGTPAQEPVEEACTCGHCGEQETTVCEDNSQNNFLNGWFSGNSLTVGIVPVARQRTQMHHRPPARRPCPPEYRPLPRRCSPGQQNGMRPGNNGGGRRGYPPRGRPFGQRNMF